jgi:hypothetical protein
MHSTIEQPCGEVIASTLSSWSCQNGSAEHSKNSPSLFGSVVVATTGDYTFFGIISEIVTGTTDSYHLATPLGKTTQERLAGYPESFAFLQTTVTCLAVGFLEKGQKHYCWTPFPLPIHTFIYHASDSHLQIIFEDEQYAQMLLQQRLAPAHLEELLLAILYQRLTRKPLCPDEQERFLETCLLVAGSEYRSLKRLLLRVEHFYHKSSSL